METQNNTEKKETGCLKWTAVGCFGMVIIIALLIVAGVWYMRTHYAEFVSRTVVAALPNTASDEAKDALKKLVLDIFKAKEADKISAQSIILLQDKFKSFYADKKITTEEFTILEKDIRKMLTDADLSAPPELEAEIDKIRASIITESKEQTEK